jgi:hypothetical protein
MLPPKLTKVAPLPHYRLALQFANGEQGELDMTPYLQFGIFSRLTDPTIFAQAHLHFDTIEWPCGVDLDPAFIYQKTMSDCKT